MEDTKQVAPDPGPPHNVVLEFQRVPLTQVLELYRDLHYCPNVSVTVQNHRGDVILKPDPGVHNLVDIPNIVDLAHGFYPQLVKICCVIAGASAYAAVDLVKERIGEWLKKRSNKSVIEHITLYGPDRKPIDLKK